MAQHVREVDVIVAGTGPAGMAAVTACARAGVEVAAIEPLDTIGGNAVWSTGYLAFVNSEAQKDAGVSDSIERYLSDAAHMVELLGDRFGVIWDRELTRLFAEESSNTYDFLVSHGVRFSRFIPRPRQHTVDRMLAIEDTWMLKRAHEQFFAMPNVHTFFGHFGERLIMDGGRVVGMRVAPWSARESGEVEAFEIRARKGVVLACGGYQSNPAMRLRYQPGYVANGPYLGVGTCRGDAHIMGAAVGGDLINMTAVPPLVIVSSAFVEDSIAVNRAGQRFTDEAGPYEERVDAVNAQPERWGHFIFDNETMQRKPQLAAQMPQECVSAPTLRDLAGVIGCDPDGLEASVAQWNAFLASGAESDPATGRVIVPEERRQIKQGPFWSSRMVVGINFVCGGFNTTLDMQVVNAFGEPIPGLWAAGDAAGGMNVTSDLGGVHIAGGLTLGRIAGQSAAAGKQSAPKQFKLRGEGLPSMLATRIALVHLPGEK